MARTKSPIKKPLTEIKTDLEYNRAFEELQDLEGKAFPTKAEQKRIRQLQKAMESFDS